MAISESEVKDLLQKVYGFISNDGRNGSRKLPGKSGGKHLSIWWDWMQPNGSVFAPNVVYWALSGSFSPDFIADRLGLTLDELELAIKRELSKECLILALLIHQADLFLKKVSMRWRESLRQNYKEIIKGINSASVGSSCCRLLIRLEPELHQLSTDPDTTQLEKDLSAIIAALRCPGLNLKQSN